MHAEERQRTDQYWMTRALALARRAVSKEDEVPVGALLVRGDQLLAQAWNRNIRMSDPTAHAEILALRRAGRKLANYRLPGTTLYVTLEPCAMCAMALVHARVHSVVYAASDPKTGAAGSVFDILGSALHNHRIIVRSGILAAEAGGLLKSYFRAKRQRRSSTLPDNQP